MTSRSGILTLLSDFGVRDAYVAAMKGAILRIGPSLQLVDVSHEIPPQDIMQGAFVLRDAARFFPEGTVHVAVVDPGVGSERHPIAIHHRGHLFVGPDNGLFSLILEEEPETAVILDRPEFWRDPKPGSTFHGRDIFGPVAARLALGARVEEVGSPLSALKPLHWALPIHDDQGIRGWVVHIDRFGNCITNITREHFTAGRRGRRFKCYAGTVILDATEHSYASVPGGDPLLLFNSSELLEVAVSRGSASELFGLRTGSPINVVFQDGPNV